MEQLPTPKGRPNPKLYDFVSLDALIGGDSYFLTAVEYLRPFGREVAARRQTMAKYTAMAPEQTNLDIKARTLLERLPALQQFCDLDLLVFFSKHPLTLKSKEQLAHLLGYPANEIIRSLDALFTAGFLAGARNTVGPAMYLFETGGTNGGLLLEVVEFASTRLGRLALRLELASSLAGATGMTTQATDDP